MYIYQNYKPVKKKRRWPYLIFTFIVAVSGSYLAQTYFGSRVGSENNVSRLSSEATTENTVNYSVYSRENVIEEAMRSVVGISIIKANEESLFDVFLAEKWGLRDWNYNFGKWLYFNKSAYC